MRYHAYNSYSRKYKLNEKSFEKINSELKAYCLGFLYADGAVRVSKKGYSVAIHLAEKDKEILNLFASAFETDIPIRIDKRGYALLPINSRILVEDLINLGVFTQKTFKIRFPFEKLEDKYYSHFIRGYFDGDGSFTCDKKKACSATFSLVANFKFCEDIQSILTRECSLKETKIYPIKSKINPKNIIGKLAYGGSKAFEKIYAYLYKNSSFFLQRKRNKADLFIERFSKNREKPRHNKVNKIFLFDTNLKEVEIKIQESFFKVIGLSKISAYALATGKKKSVKGWTLSRVEKIIHPTANNP